MILVDTSVWIDHLRHGNDTLRERLDAGEVVCHPFVIGEMACGTISRRTEVLALLAGLPQLPVADHAEAMHVITARRLMSRGLGWVDIHLLASALMERASLMTLDRSLAEAATRLGLA